MVVVISYVVAIILTVLIALTLYPIGAIFWVLGLLGKLSDGLFSFTQKTIKKLWEDINNTEIRSRKITNEVVAEHSDAPVENPPAITGADVVSDNKVD